MNDALTPANRPDYQPVEPIGEYEAPASRIRLKRFLIFLLKYWWIPVVTLAIGFMAEAAYVYWKAPTFVSKASMWETVKMSLPGGEFFSEDMGDFLGTQSALLQSETLRQQALARLKATTNNTPIVVGEDGEPLPVDIRVTGNAKSSVFVIQAISSNPLFTQTYLDALMGAYLDYKRNVRKEVSGDTLASISEQVQRSERDLKTEQDALLTFQRTNNLAILEEEAAISGSYLAKLKTELSDLQLEARLLNATKSDQSLAAAGPVAVTSGTTSQSTDTAVSEQLSSYRQIELLKAQRERLSKYLRPKHPKIVKLDEDIERGEKLQEIYRKQNLEQLDAALQANQLKTDNVLASIKEWETKVVEANTIIAEGERLKVNVQRIQSVYDRLTLLVQNVDISRNIDQENLEILEPASPSKRSYTSETNGLTLAMLGGLGAGLGIIALIAVRDDRFTSVMEVNSTLGGAVVGMLPEVKQKDGNLPLLQLNDPRHIYAESYRSLRSALLFLATEGERPRVLLITSAMPDEGKSTIAANLALTLALSGSRVLLVDGDLRKGRLDQALHMQSGPGFSELLRQTCDAGKVIQTNSVPNLSFISCGQHSGNPGDLFLDSNLDKIIARWRQEFDYVLIDSSPLFAADDASCLAPKMDGTLFVVRSNYSSARAVREALDLLAQRQARILGVIFNGTDASARSYYYYKYADYHSAAKQA
jgi:polysaccharide biosynthesis transport protein